MIGLPDAITACLFDLDGVLTGTAVLHREAWKQTFDSFLRQRDGNAFHEFTDRDYAEYVDGRPRADGVREFLRSRGITLPEGTPDDPPDAATVNGVGQPQERAAAQGHRRARRRTPTRDRCATCRRPATRA